MPPKGKKAAPPSKAPPPAPPLKDCRIAFVRLTAAGLDGVSQDDIKTGIARNEGEIVTKISQCTHLIANDQQYEKKSARVQEAVDSSNVKIVSFDWLKDSFKSKVKIDESNYLLHSGKTDDQADDQKNGQKDIKGPLTVGKKRARAPQDDAEDEDSKSTTGKKVKAEDDEGPAKQSATSLNIPVDDALSDRSNYKVVVGDDGSIYDVTLNQTNAGNNNNKFYRIQILEDTKGKHWCWTRWGRVGERGQTKMLGGQDFDDAYRQFEKKFKDKNGNSWANRLNPIGSGKYSFIERSYEDSDNEEDESSAKGGKGRAKQAKEESAEEEDEKPIESKIPEPVQRLMKLIFNQDYFNSTLADLDYDANKMPLGKLSKNTLLRGYTVLKELTTLMGTAQAGRITDMSNQYFSLIPHAFGRNRPPVLNSMPMIKKEIELLESLTDMQLANDIMKNAKGGKSTAEQMNILDRQYEGLGMQEMTPLDPKSDEFLELSNYLVKSGGHTHHIKYKVQDIFRIERQGEFQRFDASKFSKISNSDRRLLWHGSRCTNFGGILSQGLRIAPPEAPVNGYMFGKGVYLADMSTKSANYCCSYSTGGIGLLLLCEAELGKPPLKLTNANSDAGNVAAKQGSISTWGVGTHAPQGWKDAGCVHKSLKGVLIPDVINHPPAPTNEQGAYLMYNEYIAYDVAQVKLRYLFRCQMN